LRVNKILYLKKFIQKIKSIYIQKSKYSINSYKQLQEEFINKMNVIKMFPKAYPICNNNCYRKISINKYIILYSYNKNIINIKDIIHQKSKYLNNQD